MECIVTLNTSPLNIKNFSKLLSKDKIFRNMKDANNMLSDWCSKCC